MMIFFEESGMEYCIGLENLVAIQRANDRIYAFVDDNIRNKLGRENNEILLLEDVDSESAANSMESFENALKRGSRTFRFAPNPYKTDDDVDYLPF